MPRLREWIERPTGYALALGLGIALFLLLVGLNAEALPFPPNSAFSDAVTSHWPNALYLQRTIRAGEFPLWRPLIMSGQPFAANPLNKVWYPPQWLVIFLPVTLHLNVMLWLHLTLAGVGMRTFGRRLGLGVMPASIIGLAYALTPRLIGAAGAGHLDIVYAAAWFPWLLWAVERITLPDSASAGMGSDATLLGIIGALCFLADIRLSAFVFATAGAYGVYRWLNAERSRRILVSLAQGALFALALTAVQWLPLLVILPSLTREGLTAADAGVFSLQAPQLFGLLVADRGGSHETLTYVGVGILALAAVGLFVRWRKVGFWAAAALIAGLYALGQNGSLWTLLVRVAPPLLWLRVPARAWIVVVFALIVLAGFGIEALIDPANRPTLRRVIPRLSVVLFGLGLAAALLVFQIRTGAALITLALTLLCILMLNLRRRLPVSFWALLIAADLLIMDATLIQGRDRAEWLDRYQPLAETLIEANAARVYSPSYSLPQQAAAYWNIQTFGGVDPLQFRDYVSAFQAATGVYATGYSVTLPAFDGDPALANRDAHMDAARLADWQVSHVVSAFPIEDANLKLVTTVGETFVYQNLLYEHDRAVYQWQGSNTLSLPAGGAPDGILPSLHGWLNLPSGTHGTIYHYLPTEFVAGLGISAAALIVVGGLFVIGRRRAV